MEYKSLYIRGVDNAQWNKIFSYVLEKSDNFKAYLPDGEVSFVNNGFAAFQGIPEMNMKNLDGMGSSIEISGALNEGLKEVFIDYEKKSLMGHFRLYNGNRQLLYVGELGDRIIHLMDSEINFINSLGIDASKWDLIKLNSEEDDGRGIVDLFNVQTNNSMEV